MAKIQKIQLVLVEAGGFELVNAELSEAKAKKIVAAYKAAQVQFKAEFKAVA